MAERIERVIWCLWWCWGKERGGGKGTFEGIEVGDLVKVGIIGCFD